MIKDENGIAEYSFASVTNNADTVWCKSSNDEDRDLCITMAQNISHLQEICSTSDKKKKVMFPTTKRSVSPTGKESYNVHENNIVKWYRNKTELLGKRSSKLHDRQSKQSPEVVLSGLLQKYGDILEDINVSPNSRRVTPSIPALKQQNKVALSLLDWLDDLVAQEDIPPLTHDKYHNKEYDGLRADKMNQIIELAKSISVALIDTNAPKEHFKDIQMNSSGLFEVKSKSVPTI